MSVCDVLQNIVCVVRGKYVIIGILLFIIVIFIFFYLWSQCERLRSHIQINIVQKDAAAGQSAYKTDISVIEVSITSLCPVTVTLEKIIEKSYQPNVNENRKFHTNVNVKSKAETKKALNNSDMFVSHSIIMRRWNTTFFVLALDKDIIEVLDHFPNEKDIQNILERTACLEKDQTVSYIDWRIFPNNFQSKYRYRNIHIATGAGTAMLYGIEKDNIVVELLLFVNEKE